MKKWKVILEKYKTYTNYFVLAIMAINAASTVHLFIRQGVASKLALAVTLLVEVLFELGLVAIYYRLKKQGAEIHKFFLLFYIPIGLLFIIFLPHQQTPDSYAHLTRAYEVSNGVLVAQPAEDGVNGATLPVEIRHFIEREENYQYELTSLGTTLSGETYLEQEQYPSASGYMFLLYLPHVIGIWIGRLLGLPVYFILMCARICSMLMFGIMAYFAIKLAPRFKMFLMFLATMPMTLQQTTAFTADAITFGVAFLLVGYASYLIYGDVKKLTRKHLAGIYGLAAAMALCKVVYLPLMGLFALIPWKKFGSKKVKWLNGILAIMIGLALELIWMKVQATSQGTIAITDQFTFILQHPLRYVMYMFGTMADYLSTFYIASTFGMSLGAWKFDLPNVYFYLAMAMAAMVFVRGTEHFNVKKSVRLMSWVIFATVTVGFMTAMFTQWTKPGLNYVDGVQGRYFIPILTLMPLMFSSSKERQDEKTSLPFQYPLLFNMGFCVIAVATIVAVNLAR